MRPIPATHLGHAHGLLRAIDTRGRLRTDEFVTEFSLDELFPPGLENALGRLRHFISFARAAGLVKEDRGVVELTDIGRRYIRSGDPDAPFEISSQQAEWLRRQLREKHMTDSIYHGLSIGLSLLASCPPGARVATLDFGRAMAYLGRAGWDNENTLQIQGERHLLLLQSMELIDGEHRLTPTGEQVRTELTLPVHMSLLDLAAQLNPGGADAVRAAAAAEWATAAPPPAEPEPEWATPAPPLEEPEDDDANGYHTVGGFGAVAPPAEEPPHPPIVPRAAAPDEPPEAPLVAPPHLTPGDPLAPPPAAAPESVPPPRAGDPAAPPAASAWPPAGDPAGPSSPPPSQPPATPSWPPAGEPAAPPSSPPPAAVPSSTPPAGPPSFPPPVGAPSSPRPVAAASSPPPGEPPRPVPGTPAHQGEAPAPFLDARAIQAAAEADGLRLPAGVYANVAAALAAGKHLILTGPPGSGKTTLALAIARAAARAGKAHGATVVTGAPSRELLTQAAPAGRWVIADEFNQADPDATLQPLSTLLSGVPVTLEGTEVEPDRAWRVVATWNGTPPRGGTVLRRFALVALANPPAEELRALLRRQDATADEAVEKVLALGARVGAGVLKNAADHIAARQAAAPTDANTLAEEAFAAYIAPLSDPDH